MNLRRRFRLWLLLLLILSLAAASVATFRPWLLVLCGPILLSSWYLCEGHRSIHLSRSLVNIGALLALVLVGLSWLSEPDTGRVMELLGIFVLILLVLRQFQERTTREDAQQILLSAILVISSIIQSDRFLFGIIVVLWLVTLVFVVMLFQLHSGSANAESVRRRSVPAGRGHAPPLETRFGLPDLSRVRLLAVFASLGIILISIVVFVLFPRQILFRSGVSGNRGEQKSGFAETVDLISSERITSSRREVFTMRWVDPGGQSAKWVEPVLLRGAILERYDPTLGRWVADPGSDRENLLSVRVGPSRFIDLSRVKIPQQIQTYTLWFEMRSMATDIFFSPWAPVSISTFDPREVIFNRSNLLATDSGRQVIDSYSGYGIRVQPFPSEQVLEILGGGPPAPVRAVRFPVPGIRELTLAALAGQGVDTEIGPDETIWQRNRRVADSLKTWLEDNCRYTTDLRDFIQVGGEDPILSFLTRYRFGHCEYFASALTAMCRSIGIESRLVTGYVAVEYNDVTERYVVRESNAHAWTEARTGEYQWSPFDPSPQGFLENQQAANESWADSWRWIYDRIDFFWNSAIVGFDQRSQQNLTERITRNWLGSLNELLTSISGWLASANRFFAFGIAGYLWMGSVVVIMTSFAVVLLSIARRRRRILRQLGVSCPDAAARRRLSNDLRFWSIALDRIAGSGYSKQPHETPLVFCSRVASGRPRASDELMMLVDALYRIRFGDQRLDPEERRRILEIARGLDLSPGAP